MKSDPDRREKIVYKIRSAARDALLQMGENPENMITEYYPKTVKLYSSKKRANVIVPNTIGGRNKYWEEEYGEQ